MRVITFARVFPAYHPRKGEDTFFVEKIVRGLHQQGIKPFDVNCEFSEEMYYIVEGKHHTIRAGNRWKVGDYFSPRVWSGLPYRSKQIEFAPPIEIKKVWNVDIELGNYLQVMLPTKSPDTWSLLSNAVVAKNDGLDVHDFMNWFNIHPKKKEEIMKAQIICWNDLIEY